MYSSSDEDVEKTVSHTDSNNELLFLANQLCTYPEVLEKSQIPKMKKAKDEAITKIVEKYKSTFGKEVEARLIMKKLNNMKTRLKKKTDVSETGNKKVVLLDWEKKLLAAMKGESNPTITKIPGELLVMLINF